MKRVTVYFDENLHKALRIKALHADTNISGLVNDAVRQSLAEDREDLEDVANRVNEPTVSYQTFLADLTSRGQI